MTFLRVLNVQGIAGLAACMCLAVLLIVQKTETGRLERQGARLEQLHRAEQAAFASTVADYRAAADAARAADRANAARVAAEQSAINERIENDFEIRLAAARAHADRLRDQARSAAAGPGDGGAARMPALSVGAGKPAQAPGEDGLPDRLLATEQAIQLDELIKWVTAQAKIDPNSD